MKGEKKKMKNYLFTSKDGEEFIVEAITKENAKCIALDYFNEPKFICELSDFEAEMSGIDTY